MLLDANLSDFEMGGLPGENIFGKPKEYNIIFCSCQQKKQKKLKKITGQEKNYRLDLKNVIYSSFLKTSAPNLSRTINSPPKDKPNLLAGSCLSTQRISLNAFL
jgi:hypothetical protein